MNESWKVFKMIVRYDALFLRSHTSRRVQLDHTTSMMAHPQTTITLDQFRQAFNIAAEHRTRKNDDSNANSHTDHFHSILNPGSRRSSQSLILLTALTPSRRLGTNHADGDRLLGGYQHANVRSTHALLVDYVRRAPQRTVVAGLLPMCRSLLADVQDGMIRVPHVAVWTLKGNQAEPVNRACGDLYAHLLRDHPHIPPHIPSYRNIPILRLTLRHFSLFSGFPALIDMPWRARILRRCAAIPA
ncbi:hypothetical protein P175DRAFT_0527890 [Aspergillus ochraceoroseus IBT 24754]|uniref:Uncharacterized protein n=1 Tax=Aspergillus ochraceoroseus IBT 24754 TaxID=1392256 RepID=A0A2T5M7A6_9EURO|nr:uncharacterized protein P175DRAFT_0527890 [Aspergillus ochraceoroseus IBT 24754]PTU24420.1 hypothetical protein P175DRAFT_0527890 [Aspergillus ochraceoroseus IBT 24754]